MSAVQNQVQSSKIVTPVGLTLIVGRVLALTALLASFPACESQKARDAETCNRIYNKVLNGKSKESLPIAEGLRKLAALKDEMEEGERACTAAGMHDEAAGFQAVRAKVEEWLAAGEQQAEKIRQLDATCEAQGQVRVERVDPVTGERVFTCAAAATAPGPPLPALATSAASDRKDQGASIELPPSAATAPTNGPPAPQDCPTLEAAAKARRTWTCAELQEKDLREAQCVPSELIGACEILGVNVHLSDLKFPLKFVAAKVTRVGGAFEIRPEQYAPSQKVDGALLTLTYRITNPYSRTLEVPVPDAFYVTTGDDSICTMPGTRCGWRGGDRVQQKELRMGHVSIGWMASSRNPISFSPNQTREFQLTFPPVLESISVLEILEFPLIGAGRVDAIYAIPQISMATGKLVGMRVSYGKR